MKLAMTMIGVVGVTVQAEKDYKVRNSSIHFMTASGCNTYDCAISFWSITPALPFPKVLALNMLLSGMVVSM